MNDFTIPADGPLIASEADFLDLVGNAAYSGAERIVVPAGRLSPDFFRLSTGLAGAILQKCSTYQLKGVIVGDIAGHIARFGPLRDFVYESNRRGDVRFIATDAEL